MDSTKRILLLALVGALSCFSSVAKGEALPISDDVAVRQGNWAELASRYPVAYVSVDRAEAPSVEGLANWWELLGDPTLTDLIAKSLTGNRDLQVAQARVSEARASLGISKAALLPWLDSNSSWTRSSGSENSTGPGSRVDLYRLGVDASWEIDIFGGNRHKVSAGTANLEAQHAALHATWVTLSSEVALNYVSLRTLQQRLLIAERNLALQIQTLQLLESRYRAGLSDALSLNQARYTVEQTRSAIPPIKLGIENTLNALAILTGNVPGSMAERLSAYQEQLQPDGVDLIGIPADYLRQRPDIRAAERQLAAQIARTKSAQTDLYPKLILWGSIGLESLSTGNLFSSNSQTYGFGPKLSWPIFHAGAIRNNIRVQNAKQEQLLAAYEQSVLGAVAEVRDALASSVLEKERNHSLRQGVLSAREALDIANDKYRNGLSDFNNVIDAQRALLSFEEQLAISEGQRVSNVVRIFKALGGGWAPLTEQETVR